MPDSRKNKPQTIPLPSDISKEYIEVIRFFVRNIRTNKKNNKAMDSIFLVNPKLFINAEGIMTEDCDADNIYDKFGRFLAATITSVIIPLIKNHDNIPQDNESYIEKILKATEEALHSMELSKIDTYKKNKSINEDEDEDEDEEFDDDDDSEDEDEDEDEDDLEKVMMEEFESNKDNSVVDAYLDLLNELLAL